MRLQSISLVLLIILFFLRFYSIRPNYKNGDFVRISAKILNEPVVYDRHQFVKLHGLSFYLPKNPQITYGDRVIVEGQISGSDLISPKLKKIENSEKGFLPNLRLKLISFYKKTLPEPYSSLVAGIVLGSKNMPESFWNNLKSTGTAHVVVASGTNVTMVSSFLISILLVYFKRRIAVFITIAGIFCYVFISGFDAPIVRAGIMGTIVFLSQERGRIVNTWRVLIYSAVIMLLIKPDWISDLGFILSFVATCSILLFQSKINKLVKIVPNIIREGLSTSLSAQIGVAPIIFATFGQFNLLSPIINALVLWTIPYIMVLGSVGGVIGLFVPVFGRVVLYILYPLLWYFEKILYIF